MTDQLTLVPVVPAYVLLAPSPPVVPDDRAAMGRALAASAREVAEPYVDGREVAILVPTGAATSVLVEASCPVEVSPVSEAAADTARPGAGADAGETPT